MRNIKVKISLGSLAAIAASAMVSCSSCPQEKTQPHNHLLPSEITVKYEHQLIVPQDAEVLKGIPASEFISALAQKITSGEISVADPLDVSKHLTADKIADIFNQHTDSLIDISEETLDTIITLSKREFKPSDVQSLIIYENWAFNADEFSMQKNVIEYAPIKAVRRKLGDESGMELLKYLLFWVPSENTGAQKKLLASNVTYEVELYNANNPSWMENLSASRFIDLIISNAVSGKHKAYDFFETDKIALSKEIIMNSLGASTETYYVEDDNGQVIDTVQISGRIHYDEIRSFIFVEDWYIDEQMRLSKIVKKIAPVRHYYMAFDNSETEMIKKILFSVHLKH
jgi:hypothetical protein